MSPSRFSPLVIAALKSNLDSLLDAVPSIMGVFLATDDGFEITQAISGKQFEPAKLAAMSSSMVALSHALVGEIDLGETQNMLIEARLGKVLLLSVATTPALSLTVIARPNATLGQVLVHSKFCVSRLAEVMGHLSN